MRKLFCLILVLAISLTGFGCKLFDQTPPDAPSFSHSDEVFYYESIEVKIFGEDGSDLYYTIDGSDPEKYGSKYKSAITVSGNTTLKAVCEDAAGNVSSAATAEYEFDFDSALPFISLDSGAYGSDQTITITPDENTDVYYTFTDDGSVPEEPTRESTEYTDGIEISTSDNTETVYNFKFKSFTTASPRNAIESDIAERIYTIDKKPPYISFSQGDSTVIDETIHVEIAYETGATVYYTTDGTNPTESDTEYNSAIEINTDTILKAVCFDQAGNAAAVTAEYIVYNQTNAVPFMNITEGKIFQVSKVYEYSIDDGTTWTECQTTVVDVSLSTGDNVWVRNKYDHDEIYYLGEVESTSAPDLMPLNTYAGINWYDDQDYGAPGDSLSLLVDVKNIGNADISQSDIDIEFYLSEDKTIDSFDNLIDSAAETIAAAAGETINIGDNNFTVPSVTPGTYYIGCIIDVNNEVTEQTHDNNSTIAQYVGEYHVLDSTPVSEGAIKIVNSWGTGFYFENVDDGHYWVTYDSAKSLNMAVRYYYNDFTHVYKPTIIAVFNIDHMNKDKCHVTIGLGDPDNPVIVKDFQSRWGSTSYAGDGSYPDNNIVLDISEFAPYINSHNLYLRADTSASSLSGTLNSFSVEYYSDYDNDPMKIISGNTGNFPSGVTTEFTAATTDALSAFEQEAIMPLNRSVSGYMSFFEDFPDSDELKRDKEIIGVFDENKDYNEIIHGKYGTGDVPPTKEEWEVIKKLRSIDSGTYYGTLPDEIDLSQTQYFPPIGNQGGEGSCTAFSVGYYIQTYTEAREHGWDLSNTEWGGSSPGYPLTNQDKIISPDFLYHQINGGTPGSNGSMAASFIARVGGCSWQEMPYSDEDDDNYNDYGTAYPWPGESAYREAARYRGREISPNYWDYICTGYFIIESDKELNLLKELLASGYCVSTSVYVALDEGLYILFDEHDVVSGYTGGPMSTNHANTIVGYKEGTAWDPANPDE